LFPGTDINLQTLLCSKIIANSEKVDFSIGCGKKFINKSNMELYNFINQLLKKLRVYKWLNKTPFYSNQILDRILKYTG